MPNIGPMELIVVLVIVLVVFGPKRLPGLGKQLGTGMREFKESISGSSKDDDDVDATGLPALPAAEKSDVVVEPVAPEVAGPTTVVEPVEAPAKNPSA